MIGTGCRSAMVTQHDPSVLPPSDRERRREGHCQPIRPNLHCCPQVTSAPQSPKLPLASSPSQAGAYSTGDRARFGDAVPGLPATSTERKALRSRSPLLAFAYFPHLPEFLRPASPASIARVGRILPVSGNRFRRNAVDDLNFACARRNGRNGMLFENKQSVTRDHHAQNQRTR